MSVLDTIKKFLHHVEVVVSDTFIALFGQDVAHTFAAGAEAVLNSDLGKIVWSVVQEVAAMQAGTDKRAVAFAKIGEAAKAAGIDAKDSIVNMLIEIAVQRVKGAFGPA